MAFAVVNLAVLTRLLDPSAFGALAILTLYSGLITLLCNLGTVQGTMASAYSGGAPRRGRRTGTTTRTGRASRRARRSDNRRRLTTGLVLTARRRRGRSRCSARPSRACAQPACCSARRGYAAAVVWATAAGALGSLWRIISGLPRMERRPRTFIALQLGRGDARPRRRRGR